MPLTLLERRTKSGHMFNALRCSFPKHDQVVLLPKPDHLKTAYPVFTPPYSHNANFVILYTMTVGDGCN